MSVKAKAPALPKLALRHPAALDQPHAVALAEQVEGAGEPDDAGADDGDLALWGG